MELPSALKPLRVVSQIMGLNVDGWLGRVYTLIVFSMMSSLIYASYIYLNGKGEDVLTGVDSLILWTQFVTNVIFVAVVLGVCVISQRQFLFPIRDIRKIDMIFSYFGVKINDSYLYRKQLLQILGSFIISILLTSRDLYRAIRERSFVIFLHWLYYSYAITLSMITDCLFVDYLSVINKRFSKLNQLLNAIAERNKFPTLNLAILYVIERNGIRNKSSNIVSNVEKLRILHHDLCSVSKKVNKSFGIQQLLITAISLIMITGQLYEAYHFIIMNDNPVEIGAQKIMWILFYVGRLFHVSQACSRTSYEASFTSSVIYDMPMQQLSNGVIVQMQHFSLQLIHENLNFNACGFFDIDFKLLCSIVGVVSTYLVILIQMDRKTQCIE